MMASVQSVRYDVFFCCVGKKFCLSTSFFFFFFLFFFFFYFFFCWFSFSLSCDAYVSCFVRTTTWELCLVWRATSFGVGSFLHSLSFSF
jgi:hypothetical protein